MNLSRYPRDCAIVAISLYTGRSYDEVLAAIRAFAGPNWLPNERGTPDAYSTAILTAWGLTKTTTIPRRGQEKITAIASVHSPGARTGHMIAIIDGHVFDATTEGMPLKQYQMTYSRRHIRTLWW